MNKSTEMARSWFKGHTKVLYFYTEFEVEFSNKFLHSFSLVLSCSIKYIRKDELGANYFWDKLPNYKNKKCQEIPGNLGETNTFFIHHTINKSVFVKGCIFCVYKIHSISHRLCRIVYVVIKTPLFSYRTKKAGERRKNHMKICMMAHHWWYLGKKCKNFKKIKFWIQAEKLLSILIYMYVLNYSMWNFELFLIISQRKLILKKSDVAEKRYLLL